MQVSIEIRAAVSEKGKGVTVIAAPPNPSRKMLADLGCLHYR